MIRGFFIKLLVVAIISIPALLFVPLQPGETATRIRYCETTTECVQPLPPLVEQKQELVAAYLDSHSNRHSDKELSIQPESQTPLRNLWTIGLSLSVLLGGLAALGYFMRIQMRPTFYVPRSTSDIECRTSNVERRTFLLLPKRSIAFAILIAIVGSTALIPSSTSSAPKRSAQSANRGFDTSARSKPAALKGDLQTAGRFISELVIGGLGITQVGGTAFDQSGNFYVSGTFTGLMSFDTTPQTTLISSDDFDAYIAKYDNTGKALWARAIIGASQLPEGLSVDGALSIAVDSQGNSYVGGGFVSQIKFKDANDNTVATLTDSGTGLNFEPFIAKYDANGTLLWARGGNTNSPQSDVFLGVGINGILDIAVDSSGNPFISGTASGTNFLGTPISVIGGSDALVARLDPATGNPVWVSVVGSTANDDAFSLAVDSASNVYVAGGLEGTTTFPTAPASTTLENQSGADSFIAKYDQNGQLLWVEQITSDEDITGFNIAVAATGHLYLSGVFSGSARFDSSAIQVTSELLFGTGYLAKYDTDGQIEWLLIVGAAGDLFSQINRVALDSSGNPYISGIYVGQITVEGETSAAGGGQDMFVVKLDPNADIIWFAPIVGTGTESFNLFSDSDLVPITTNPMRLVYSQSANTMYLSGDFDGLLDLDDEDLDTSDSQLIYDSLDESSKAQVKEALKNPYVQPSPELKGASAVSPTSPIEIPSRFGFILAIEEILCPNIDVSSIDLPQGTVGVSYPTTTFTQTGGADPVTFSFSGSLPPGMNLSSNGVLSGGPTQPGSFFFIVTATDANDCKGSRSFTLIVKATPSFSNLSSPVISYGTSPTVIGGRISASGVAPATESVLVTLNGVTQLAQIKSDGTFSSSFDTSQLPASTTPYTINFSFAGSTAFNSASATSQLIVNKANQTINFGLISDKVFTNLPFTLTATASSGLPMSFQVLSGPAILSGNTVTLTGAGTVHIRASQAGDSNFNPASVDRSLTVARADQTISFTAIANKKYGDAPFTLSATASSGLAVSFTVVSGPASLSGNSLTLTGAGIVTVKAEQAGDANYNPAPAATQSFTVARASTTTTLSSSSSTSNFGQSITLTAQVSGPAGTAAPTGTVTFKEGATVLGTSSLNQSGQASLSISSLSVGSHSITAEYGGDNNFTGSTSAVVTHSVGQIATTVTGVNQSATYSDSDQNLALTATVTGSAVNQGTVSCTVKNSSGTVVGVSVSSAVLADGTASMVWVLPGGTVPGSYTIEYSYSGGANFTASSDRKSLTVNKAPTTTTVLNQQGFTSSLQQTITVTAAVTGSNVNEGTVTFQVSDGNINIGSAASAAVVNGRATASYTLPADLAAKSYTIAASYSGGVKFLGSSGSGVLSLSADSSQPGITITSPGDGEFIAGTVIVTGTVTDAGSGVGTVVVSAVQQNTSSGFSIVVENAAVSGNSYRASLSGLIEGRAEITARAIDRAGNITAATVKVVVDRSGPSISLISPVAGTTPAGEAIPGVLVAGAENRVTVRVADAGVGVDEGAVLINRTLASKNADGTFSAAVSNLAEGELAIAVVARDKLGNTTITVMTFRVVARGDVNADGMVSASDLTQLVQIVAGLAGGSATAGADINLDGIINGMDLALLIRRLLSAA